MADNHYVPKFYLAEFVDPTSRGHDKAEPYVWVTDLVRSHVKNRAPINVAKIAGFYDLRGMPAGFLPLEDLYQKIENRTTRLIRRLGAGAVSCTNQERYNLASFMAFQLTRAPGVHNRLKSALEAHFKTSVDEQLSDDVWLEHALGEFNEARSQGEEKLTPEIVRKAFRSGKVKGTPTPLLLMANALHNSLLFLPLLLNMEWTFLEAAGQAAFMTGDHPVCLRSLGARQIPIDTQAFDNPDLEVTFPISPSMLLLAHQHPGRPSSGRPSDAAIANINAGMLPCLTRYVYSSRKPDAELALEMWTHVRTRLPPKD